MSGSTFIKQIVEFVNELIASLDSGVLFFGSPWDFVRYLLDIILVTFLFTGFFFLSGRRGHGS